MANTLSILAQGVSEAQAYTKCSTVRYADWQVCKNGKETIGERRLECKIMGNLVYGEEQVLVRGSTDDVRREKEW